MLGVDKGQGHHWGLIAAVVLRIHLILLLLLRPTIYMTAGEGLHESARSTNLSDA